MIDDWDGRILAGLPRKVIGERESGQRQLSFRRFIDEEDGIHRALLMKRTAQLLIKPMTRDQRAKRTLATDLLQARAGGIGIHRNITRAGLHDSKNGRNRGGRLVQVNADPIAAHDPVRDQAVRDLVTKLIQLAVGERLVQQSHRFGVRTTLRARSEKLMQQIGHQRYT